MKTYKDQGDGSFLLEGGRTIDIDGTPTAVDLRIPSDPSNRDRQAMLAEITAGDAVVEAATWVEPSQAEKDAEAARQTARDYLASTDWYIIREAEAGTPVPQAITDARTQARLDADEA